MRHHRAGKKLNRDSAHRRALYANLAGALIEHGRGFSARSSQSMGPYYPGIAGLSWRSLPVGWAATPASMPGI